MLRDVDLRALQLLFLEPGLSTSTLRFRAGYQRHEALEGRGWIRCEVNPPAKLWFLTGKGRQVLMNEMGIEGIKDLRDNGVPPKVYSKRLGSIEKEIIRYVGTFPGSSSTEINSQCGGNNTYRRLEAKGVLRHIVDTSNGWRTKRWFLTDTGTSRWHEFAVQVPTNGRGKWVK